MKYRSRKELAALSLAQVLDELARLKIQPAPKTQYAEDGPVVNGVLTNGGPAQWLESWQQREIEEKGSTLLTMEQMTDRASNLEMWRTQLHTHGVWRWIESLGATKLQKELRARNAEATPFEARTFNRKDLEKKLWFAMANDKEEREA
jgi:hypothetical protein